MSSFAIPLSGLEASSDALSVISNNLANLNTDGYKDQTLNFGDIFSQIQGLSGNGDPVQIGGGVQVENTVSNFSNGGVDSTGVAANMALQGNGFFVVSNANGTSYTRDGAFSVNSAGQIVDSSGDQVMGFQASSSGLGELHSRHPGAGHDVVFDDDQPAGRFRRGHHVQHPRRGGGLAGRDAEPDHHLHGRRNAEYVELHGYAAGLSNGRHGSNDAHLWDDDI